jgi:YihY family inner membrane protein
VDVFIDRRVSRSGAEFAYYALMTVFPLMILVVGIIGVLPIQESTVMGVLQSVLPTQAYELIQEYVAYVLNNLGSALLITGLLSTMTMASAAFRSLISISAEIYGRRVLKGMRFWVFSFLYSLLLLVFIYVTMVVVLSGSWFIQMLNGWLGISIPSGLWNWTKSLFLFALALLSLMLLYRMTFPGRKDRPTVGLGAFLSSVALTAFSALFALFITLSSRYSVVYGSLASIIILMVWLYFCGNIIVIGNVVNYVRWTHRQGGEVTLLLEKVL